MATRFMRVDLSDEARDFRPIALEPGVPMLDKSNANARILFRWVGRLLAEPVWEGESVSFFVRDDHGGRLEEVACQPATAEDLEKLLQEDLAALKERIEKAKPETPTERAAKKMLRRSFEQLTEDPHRTDLDCYFFRYRDVQGHWRLVWCWGYQRVDQEPAPAVVCTDPECDLLFVRRPGKSPKCPSCEAALATRPAKRSPWKRGVPIALLLLLLAGALVYWYLHPNRLIATPPAFTGPVGSRVPLKIDHAGLFPFLREDVTSRVVGVVLDPAVARFDQTATTATLAGRGRTLLRFHLGDLKTDVTLVARKAENPEKIVIEPGHVELAVGTTARLKLIGEYNGGARLDLTDAAEWTARNDGIVFAYDGLLEGLTAGKTAVAARYRADPDADYLDAAAEVTVVEVPLRSLRVAIDPLPVGVGRASRLRIDAVSEQGKSYSVLESSRLGTEVDPPSVAAVEGRHLKGRHAGQGKLAVTFNETLSGGAAFDVVFGPRLDTLVVTPRKLRMAVGEIRDLNVVSPSSAPVRVTSPDAAVVEVSDENRLIGRGEGTVTVDVTQGSQKRQVEVAVAAAEFQSIAVDPARLVVPVDDSVPTRVLARIQHDRRVEISPDLLTCRKRPSPRYADFDARSMQLHGVTPTDPSVPQTLAFRFHEHEASAPVEVLLAPFRLALVPSGEVDVPLGQQIRLEGWATYRGGRRAQVPPGRLAFHGRQPDGAAAGLQLRGDKVAALQPAAGPLPVCASYFGRESKPTVFRSVEAEPVRLRLDVDRTLRLAGEPGQVTLLGTGPEGDVDLVPELAAYESSDPNVLRIDEKTGAFAAVAPGEVAVTASHLAAQGPARLTLQVFDPADAKLVFQPDSLRVAVDEVARLQLLLEVRDGQQVLRAPLTGPDVGYAMTQPEAVRWSPPILVGVSPAAPFDLSASYYPILSSLATAQVEVVPAVDPEAIRIVPSEVSLAPGQAVALKVEQQLAGAPRQWREVRPGAVGWTVPPELIWAPATGNLRPAATIPPKPPSEFELRAEYHGKQAVGVIKTKTRGPDPDEPGARIVLLREPEGVYLPVGTGQRYSIAVEKNGVVEPAAGIQWPKDFENQYVRWQAPVLTAKRAGYRQWLRAEVDGQTLRFYTSTYRPSPFDRPPPRQDVPLAVEILSDQGPSVRFPVGAQFDDFRVEAHYADGFTRLVTKKATLRTPEPPQSAPLGASQGRLIGVRPGQTLVHAEFEGVRSKQPLGVEVTAELDVDQIRIAPAPVTLGVGETYPLQVRGYKNQKPLGIINGLGDILWQSSHPQIARVDGPSVTGIGVGQGTVTVQLGGIVSAPVRVNVVDSIADALLVDPRLLRIRVGQGARIGTDLSVFRGDMDVSGQCTVTPALPGVVQYVPETHSLVGISPGASAVALSLGEKLTNVMVEVVAGGGPIDGEVVVEPSAGNLAPGQALDLRVLVVSPVGDRIDRTDSAVLSSSDPARVRIQANRACAVASGTAEITATLPGTEQTGSAYLTVSDEEITELIVEPPQLAMSVGDLRRLRILGRAAGGTHELFPQDALKVAPTGPRSDAIQIVGAADVDALRPAAAGEAAVAIDWQDRLRREVPVTVGDDPLGDLRIEPARAVIHPGQPLVYQVTGMRGGQRRVLGPEHGVQLLVSDRNVARVIGGDLAVRAIAPGHTAVMARLGGQQAEAGLDVTPGTDVVGGPGLVSGPATVDYYGPGGGYYGGPGGYWRGHHGYWDGDHWVGTRGPDYAEGAYPAPPEVARLRFVPEVLRLASNSPPVGVRVIEVLADGSDGRDVTAEPNLELTERPGVVAVEKTPGGPVLRPVGPGQARIGARLGTLTADPLLVSVGDLLAGPARLLVAPDPLSVWSGESGTFATVMLDPGAGQPLRPTDYRITPAPGQGIVASAGDRTVRGLAPGVAQVVVAAVDPAGVYDGLSTTATVRVISPDRLTIEPAHVRLQLGQRTPPLSVTAAGADGLPYQVPAVLESTDANVLAPDPELPGRFTAQALGGAEIRATYRAKEAFAGVTVSGRRFVQVVEDLDRGTDDFGVVLTVLADKSENPLEYRVYVAGQPPGAVPWTAATRLPDGAQRVTLHSPRMPYGPPNSLYNLILKARDPSDASDASGQQYPFTFRLRPEIERADTPLKDGRTNQPQ